MLILGDCLEEMAKLPSASVDLILCDLPYGTTQNKWDSVIDLNALWVEYWRVAKPNAPRRAGAPPRIEPIAAPGLKTGRHDALNRRNPMKNSPYLDKPLRSLAQVAAQRELLDLNDRDLAARWQKASEPERSVYWREIECRHGQQLGSTRPVLSKAH